MSCSILQRPGDVSDDTRTRRRDPAILLWVSRAGHRGVNTKHGPPAWTERLTTVQAEHPPADLSDRPNRRQHRAGRQHHVVDRQERTAGDGQKDPHRADADGHKDRAPNDEPRLEPERPHTLLLMAAQRLSKLLLRFG